MNRKVEIAICALLIFGMLSMATIGTLSYFNDIETSSGNVLTAGSLDLTVDGQNDPNVQTIDVAIKPGDTINKLWVLKNVGSVNGNVSISFANIVNYENGITEPEGLLDTTTGDTQGELGGILYAQIRWRQPTGTGTWNQIRLVMWGDPKLNGLVGPYGLGENGGPIIPTLGQNGEVEIQFRLWWDGRFSTPADNVAQTDSVVFDVVFRLDQA